MGSGRVSSVVKLANEVLLKVSREAPLPFPAVWDFSEVKNSEGKIAMDSGRVDLDPGQALIQIKLSYDGPGENTRNSTISASHPLDIRGNLYWILYERRGVGTFYEEFVDALQDTVPVQYSVDRGESIVMSHPLPAGAVIQDAEGFTGRVVASAFRFEGYGFSRRAALNEQGGESMVFFSEDAQTRFPQIPCAVVADGAGGFRRVEPSEVADGVVVAIAPNSYRIGAEGFYRLDHGLITGDHWVDYIEDGRLVPDRPQTGTRQRILNVIDPQNIQVFLKDATSV